MLFFERLLIGMYQEYLGVRCGLLYFITDGIMTCVDINLTLDQFPSAFLCCVSIRSEGYSKICFVGKWWEGLIYFYLSFLIPVV